MNSTAFSRLAGSIVVGTAMVLLTANHQARGELEFGIPTPMPETVNRSILNGIPSLSPDNQAMYITSDRPGTLGENLDVWVSEWDSANDAWGMAQHLADPEVPVNTPDYHEMCASITEDGLELYFERTTDFLGHVDGDIWVTRRASSDVPWGEPELLPLNTDGRDAGPFISPDGLALYFDSDRLAGFPIPENTVNTFVARAASRSEPFGDPEHFFISGAGTISDDELTYLFSGSELISDYFGLPTAGGEDLYISTRESPDDDFGEVVHLAPPISTPALDCCSDLSSDGSTYYFTSDRPGGPGVFNIWQAPIAEAVPVDIKPGSDPNSINLKSEGVLPVAILSTDVFNALDVDVETVLFGDPLLIADGGTPVGPVDRRREDVTRDGLPDLVLHFSVPEMVNNGVLDLLSVQGYVTGTTLGGDVIAGRDAVRMIRRLGDVNADGEVNGLDVDPFVDVLLNGPYDFVADMNKDGAVNGLDVDRFVKAVLRGGPEEIPEPSTIVLVGIGLLSLLACTRRRASRTV